MTPKEITKLAEKLAKDWIKVNNLPNCLGNEVLSGMAKEMERVIRFILRTHCIVSREKVEEIKEDRYLKEYEFLKERCIEDLNPERMDWHDMRRLCDGMYYALKQLLDETDK